MASHSSTLAWKLPWMEEAGRLQSMELLRVRHDWATSLSLSCIGEGNGNPLHCSCLENPRDWGGWWAAVSGVAQSLTQLKWLRSSSSSSSSGGDRIPVELFQILKDDAVKVLHSICQQIWKTQQWPQDWKRSVFSNPKERQCQRILKLPHNCTHLTS